jgi:hypothetical protein
MGYFFPGFFLKKFVILYKKLIFPFYFYFEILIFLNHLFHSLNTSRYPLFSHSNCFVSSIFTESIRSFKQIVMSSQNQQTIQPFPSIFVISVYFSCIIVVVRLQVLLTIRVERMGFFGSLHWFRGKNFSLLPLSIMLDTCLSCINFIMFRHPLLILNLLKVLVMKRC